MLPSIGMVFCGCSEDSVIKKAATCSRYKIET